MNTTYLLLGSNLDDRQVMIRQAVEGINDRIGTVTGSSSVYESEPWGFKANGHFLNQVVQVDTGLSPHELLEAILQIELKLGRKRDSSFEGYSSRSIDIDILFYNEDIISDNDLNIPHPRISERMFTLLPLCELNASMVHPVYKLTLQELKALCKDPNEVFLYQS
jgi:2-amino-4-hydroxy-6-hydroxymethyldihydropteridine diphosphokinase